MSFAPTGSGLPSRMLELLAAGAARARAEGRRVLVSASERVATIDPLDALDSVSRGAVAEAALAGHAAAGRMYWARPRSGFAIAGVGAAMTLSPSGQGRFAEVDANWRALREGALVADDSNGEAGVGPLLLGGASFDPQGPRAAHWAGFPSTMFVLPRAQVTTVNGACWLTMNAIVGRDGSLDVGPAALESLRAHILDGQRPSAPASNGVARSFRATAPALEELRPGSDWRSLVASAVDAIGEGGMTKVVLARAVHARVGIDLDVTAMLHHLREAYPDCHVFGCWRGERVFLGASPERLVRLEGRDVLASSLAGSAPRGATPRQDVALAESLMESEKDRAEHAIVRESLCAGLEELCDDISAPTVPSLFTLPHVHHLHTAVRARLREGRSLLDLVAQLHPTPAVGGAPRQAALRFIRDHEGLDRGWYAAPIGWVGREGGEFAVGLRSAVVQGSEAWMFAGSGIVADSDPDAEFAETLLKLRPMEQAIAAGMAHGKSGDRDAGDVMPARVGDGGAD